MQKKLKQDVKLTLIFIMLFLLFCFTFYMYIKQNKEFKDYINSEHVCTSGKTIFFGDSIIEIYDLLKYFKNDDYINKGVSGNTTKDLLDRVYSDVIDYNPSRVVLLIGTNDNSVGGISKEESVENIYNLIGILVQKLPNTKIYVQSIYPVDEKKHSNRSNTEYEYINKKVKELSYEVDNLYYIDLYNDLLEDGKFSKKYTDDGLHPNEEGYRFITSKLNERLIKDL